MKNSLKILLSGLKEFINDPIYEAKRRVFDFRYELNETLKWRYIKSGDFSKNRFSRFLTKDDDLDKKRVSITWKAFRHDKKRNELSVYDTTALGDDKIVSIGRRYVISKSIQKIHGYATVRGKEYENQRLRFSYNNFPSRHANVVGWPLYSSDNRDQLMAIGKVLAANCDLRLY